MSLAELSDQELISRYNETKNLAAKYKIFQESLKILLNSNFGVMGNQYFRWFDPDNAEAITSSGQVAIQLTMNKLNLFMNKIFKTENVDYCIFGDTDSAGFDFSKLVYKVYPDQSRVSKPEIVDMLDKFSKEHIQPILNETFDEYAQYMNVFAKEISMKREKICERGVWADAKKRYLLNVWDEEGVRFPEPEIKIKGLETRRSDIPLVCRDALKEAYSILLNKSESDMIKYITDFKEKFFSMSFEEIANPRSVNLVTKYYDKSNDLWIHGAPMHVRAAILYNHLLKEHKVEEKYFRIFDKDKFKFVRLKAINPTPGTAIGAPKHLPPEFGLEEYIDYDLQFEKCFLEPIERLLKVVGWKSKIVYNLEAFFG